MRKFILGLALVVGAGVAGTTVNAAPMLPASVAVAATHVQTAHGRRRGAGRVITRRHYRHYRHNRRYR